MKDQDLQKAWSDASKAWESNEIARAKRSERRAWIFAGIGLGTALAACIAVACLTPLKTVEPFIVRVEKSTGDADIISRLDQHVENFDEVIDKYWLASYVNYRESYSNAMALPNYQAVSLMSSKQVGAQYFAQIDPNNPHAPVNVYKKTGLVDISINAVAFLGNNVAQVRFTRTELENGAPTGKQTNWIATITYRYLAASMSEKYRLINPLGFQVTDYRVDPETVKTGT
ncbi:virB8 family protein [Dyella sp. M7H15-1]|uniref:virB8 family protein n=1 Tax=Dyella sp. M7H15-1 TaxID=2501295 RepID=UPI001004DEC4|nr:VirB8/TrbF family protein [Dyella sp. M7H15-1]QAU23384.1 virB8 family protein [Dyella sp. M7H15-1]